MMEATWEEEFAELKQRFYFYNSDWLPTHDGLLDGKSTNLYKTYSWSPNFLYRDEWDEMADYRSTGGTKGYTKKGDVNEFNVDEHLDMKQREFYWDAIAAEIGRQIENQAEPPCALEEWKLRRRADILLKERFRVKPKTKLHKDGMTSNGKGTRKTASAHATIQRVKNDVPLECIPKPVEKKELAVELITDESDVPVFQLNINPEDHLVELPESIFDQTMDALRNLAVDVQKPVAIKLDDIDDDKLIGKDTQNSADVKGFSKKKVKGKKKGKQEKDGTSNEDLSPETPSLFDNIDMEEAYDAEFDSFKLEKYMSEPTIPDEWFDESASGRHRDWIEGKHRQGGFITVNGKPLGDYFAHPYDRHEVMQPLIELGVVGEFDIDITVKGGGTTGQAQAAKLAVARAVQNQDVDLFRPLLRKHGHLSVDTRQVERKKPGLKKARKAAQWVKR
jgi:small subunit ribosomal protein S9